MNSVQGHLSSDLIESLVAAGLMLQHSAIPVSEPTAMLAVEQPRVGEVSSTGVGWQRWERLDRALKTALICKTVLTLRLFQLQEGSRTNAK
jgi:hypothetical protein